MNKTERIIIEVVHDGNEVVECEHWVEGDFLFDENDYIDRQAHISAMLSTTLGHTIVTMTKDVAEASFAAGQFFELVLEQIKDEFEEEEK